MEEIISFVNKKRCGNCGIIERYETMFFINRNEEGRLYWFYRDGKLGVAIAECGSKVEVACDVKDWKLDTLVRYLSSQALRNSLEDRLTAEIRRKRFSKI